MLPADRERDCWSVMEPPRGPGLGRAWYVEDEEETLALLLPEVRKLLAREVDSAAIDAERRIPERVRRAAAELGLFGLTIPEAYGGLGLSLKAACRIVDELARVDRSVAVMVGLHCGLGSRGLVELGNEAARRRWLPRMAQGEVIGAFAATEPQAGSDLMAVATHAVPEGDGLRLSGEKCFVTNGKFAGVFTVLARTPGAEGGSAHTMVAVAADAPGLEVTSEEHKMGIRGSSAATVLFDDVPLGPDDVLGERGEGLAYTHAVLGWGRTLMSAGCVGTAQAALAATLQHVLTRRQFGKPIGELPLVREHVAHMAAQVYASEALVRWAGESEASGRGVGAPSLVAKVFCSESAFEVCDLAIQLHGAMGFLEPTGVPRMLRDCRITRIFEGANDVLLVRHGAALAASAGAPPPGSLAERVGPALEEMARRWDEAALRLRSELGEARKFHGLAVVGKQTVLEPLARADVELRAAAAALGRAAAEDDPAGDALALHAADSLIAQSMRRLDDARARPREQDARVRALTEALYHPVQAAGAPRAGASAPTPQRQVTS